MKADIHKREWFFWGQFDKTVIFFCSQQRTDGQFLRITDPVGYFKDNFSIMNVIIVIVDVVYQLYFHLNLKE